MRAPLRLPALALAGALGLLAATGGAGSPALAACSIDALAHDSRLASFSGYVADAETGATLFDDRGDVPASTGSVLKLLTATAALDVLGAKHRLTTKVVQGRKPGTIVLVGGGDPTLTRVSNGYYPRGGTLASLAAQLRGMTVKKIVVDTSMWDDADAWDRTWKQSEQQIGYSSYVSALQVDGDRDNPHASVSHRSTNPAHRAGRWFAAALGKPRLKVVRGVAPVGAAKLAVVKSARLDTLLRFELLTSDGTLAESIARVTSLAAGGDGSRASLDRVVSTALQKRGLDTTGQRFYDGSGLSTRNAVSPRFVTDVLRDLPAKVAAGLSIAGRTGSLATRFTGGAAIARGHVLAKTGWLDTEYSLAGIVHARDGSEQVFAFYAIGPHVSSSAKLALDSLAAGVYRCGASLS